METLFYTAVSSAIEIGIGDNTTISLPTPVDVAAAMLVEFNNGTFYYEGPIPSPTQAADGANSFVKAASSSDGDGGSMLTGAFGFSTERAFSLIPLLKFINPQIATLNRKIRCKRSYDRRVRAC